MNNEELEALRDNTRAIRELAAELKLTNSRHGRWTTDEEETALALYKDGLSNIEISRELYNQFNTERSSGAVDTRLRLIGAYNKKPKLDYPKLADSDKNRPIMDRLYEEINGEPF